MAFLTASKYALPAQAKGAKPALWYRLTGAMNRVIWQAPLPRRLSTWLSWRLYRSPPMRGEQVLGVLDALKAAEVKVWVSGGWGVEALLGEQSRVHRDLDLILDSADGPRAVEALERVGYRVHYRVTSDKPTHARTVLNDDAARVVDLHPVDLDDAHLGFARGTIGRHQSVPCLSVASQLTLHQGYKQRKHDRLDVASLRRLA